MTESHWCSIHEQPFFKKGGMKGYAHPIVDENGEPTGKWCNESKEKFPPPIVKEYPDEPESPQEKPVITKEQGQANSRNKAFALSYAKDFACAKIAKGEELNCYDIMVVAQLFEAYLNTGELPQRKQK